MLLLDDAHWIDAGSDAFLAQTVEAVNGTRTLLLVNFRPEYHADWMSKPSYRQIPLRPLGREATAELLADLLGRNGSLAGLSETIHERTRGNPFFIEEVVLSLVEKGCLEGTRGAYRLVVPVEELEIPDTVRAVLAARIDRLPEREKQLLQTASVIGKEVPGPVLARVAGLSDAERAASLAALVQGEFLFERALYPEAEYAFKHPLTQEVALGSQLRERRRHAHAAVARAIEQQDAEHLDERAALLAHHWEEAGEALSAARWHRRGAEWVGMTDVATATRHWGRVRALLRDLSDDREAATLGIAACRQLLNVGFRVGTGLDEARALLEEGQALANAIGDRRAQLYLPLVYGRARCGAGDVATYLELAIESQRAALEIDDIAVQANASLYLCFSLFVSGRLPEAIQVAEHGLARFPRDVPSAEWLVGANPLSVLSSLHGRSLAWAGRLPEGLEELGRARRLVEEDGTPEMAAYALYCAAEASHLANDADRALASARQVEEVTRRLGEMPSILPLAQLAVGHAHLAAGRAADAIEPARAALDLHGRVEKYEAGMAATLLAEALLEAGDLSAAEAAASEAIALCRRSLRAIYEAVAHGVLARALLRRDGAAARDAAEAALADAAALIERTGARTLAPALCEWRAELAAVLGDDVTRAQLLRQAQQGYDEIGAPAHAERISRQVSAISARPKGQ